MSTQIALLRGINVGGSGKLPMAELREILGALGARAVETYIQSGNAVYEGALAAEDIAAAIETRCGFRPKVIVLNAEELLAAARANPFPEAVTEPKTLHLFFLDGNPNTDPSTLAPHGNGVERWHLAPGVLYLLSPGGLSKSKLAQRIERLLGVPMTARNWSTVSKLCEMAKARL